MKRNPHPCNQGRARGVDRRHRRFAGLALLASIAVGTGGVFGADVRKSAPGDELRLSYRWITTADLLAELSKSGPGRLQAVSHLRDRRVSVAVEGSRGAFKAALASLLGTRKNPAKWVTLAAGGEELWQSRKAITEGLEQDRAERAYVANAMRALAELTESDFDENNQTVVDARVPKFNKPWALATGALIRGLPPEELEAGLSGRPIWKAIPDLPPGLQQVLYDGIGSKVGRRGKLGANGLPISKETWEEQRQRFLGGEIGLRLTRSERGDWSMRVTYRDDQHPGEEGSLGTGGPEIGFLDDDQQPGPTLAAIDPDSVRRYLGDHAVECMDDVAHFLREVAGYSSLSQHYARREPDRRTFRTAFLRALESSRRFDQLLDAICRWDHYRWSMVEDTVVLRSKQWWVEDEAEPPHSLARRLSKGLLSQGFLNLIQLSDAAALPARQAQSLNSDYLCGGPLNDLPHMTAVLLTWRLASPPDRVRMERSGGISFGRIPPELLTLFERQTWITRWFNSLPPDRIAQCRLGLRWEPLTPGTSVRRLSADLCDPGGSRMGGTGLTQPYWNVKEGQRPPVPPEALGPHPR